MGSIDIGHLHVICRPENFVELTSQGHIAYLNVRGLDCQLAGEVDRGAVERLHDHASCSRGASGPGHGTVVTATHTDHCAPAALLTALVRAGAVLTVVEHDVGSEVGDGVGVGTAVGVGVGSGVDVGVDVGLGVDVGVGVGFCVGAGVGDEATELPVT